MIVLRQTVEAAERLSAAEEGADELARFTLPAPEAETTARS
jgi:hypothetical protein